jgi:VanZ family protein
MCTHIGITEAVGQTLVPFRATDVAEWIRSVVGAGPVPVIVLRAAVGPVACLCRSQRDEGETE